MVGQRGGNRVDAARWHDEHHADPHVEHAFHLGEFDTAHSPDLLEYPRDLPGRSLHYSIEVAAQHTSQVPRKSTPSDMDHPVDLMAGEGGEHRRGVDDAG